MAIHVLVIEDDPNTQNLIEVYVQSEPFVVHTVDDGFKGLEYLKKEKVDIVVTDVRLPRISGEELVSYIHSLHPNMPIIVMTGYGSVEGAVNFLRKGAFDYMTKPFTRQVFIHRLHLAARQLELLQEVDKLRADKNKEDVEKILGNHPAIMRIMSVMPSIAQTNAAVLILGESGTGKEMLARAIHNLSRRNKQNFVAVNCGALPEQLMESELFGYKKGAFTDAKQDRNGLVDEANMGTLFLDEIGELPSSVQVKLLRFLQEKEYRPLGSTVSKQADVRILAATNQNLERDVREGKFREDLYYRLNVIPINLPPLRERDSDIPLIVEHYLKKFATEHQRHIDSIAPEVMQHLMDYDWPGNIRELINTVQRLVVMAQGSQIDMETLDRSGAIGKNAFVTDTSDTGFKKEKQQVVSRFEKEYVNRCLTLTRGNVSAAARLAKIDRKNFWQLMQKHKIEAKEAK